MTALVSTADPTFEGLALGQCEVGHGGQVRGLPTAEMLAGAASTQHMGPYWLQGG
ncbi:hypothetical protein GCM10009751_36650 [Myceligenerans crystallogenes]|uniref:Uncharacterized protein n=1 Tax=Myceligenerans crystallogenes TaxID=316335 RepID=A0ABN2NP22_9MICO